MNAEANQKPAGYTACFVIYVLYIIAPILYVIVPSTVASFTFSILWIAGLLMAFVNKSKATPEIAGHLDYAKRLGITGLFSCIIVMYIALLIMMITGDTLSFSLSFSGAVIAWLPYLIWWAWSLAKSVRGLDRLITGRRCLQNGAEERT